MSRITNRRLAGKDHAVLTLEGGDGRYRRRPCSDCPWRKDATGVFPPEAFKHSANTGADGSALIRVGDDALHTFACHQQGTEKAATCAGYILRGDDAIGWRIAVVLGRFDPKQVSDDGIELHDDYFAMAVSNGVPGDDPALDHCRPWGSDCGGGRGTCG